MKRRKKQGVKLMHDLPHIAVLLSVLLPHFIYPHDDLKIFLTFIALIPLFACLKLDSRIPAGYAILMLTLAAIILAFRNNEVVANQLAIYAYWLLVVSVTLMLIEYVRESRRWRERR